MTASLAETVLLRALEEVAVAADRRSATVAGTALTADDPRQLEAQLAVSLYGLLHSGQNEEALGRAGRWRDLSFEDTLREQVPHQHTRASARVLAMPPGPAGDALVEWSGLRLRVPSELVGAGPTRDGMVPLSLPACRPAVSPGFFLVEGSRPVPYGGGLLRLYVHLASPQHAPAVLAAALSRLEDRGVRYQAKVLSQRELYPRRDALVVYLPEQSWPELAPLAAALTGMPGTAPETSVLAHRLAPGVAVAFEPDDPRPARAGMSFGQHRCAVLAEALVATAGGAGPLAGTLAAACAAAGIDPERPARNTSSPDFPVDEPDQYGRR